MISIPQEIYYLSKLTCIACGDFNHALVGAKVPSPSSTAATSLLTYTPPENLTWIVTRFNLRSIPPVNDPALTVGDWRSEDYDASGTAQAYLQVKQRSVTAENASYFLLFNKPVLFAFQGGQRVDVVIKRAVGFAPPDEVIVLALNSYLAPPEAYDRLARNLTQIDATYS